jgi:hypothetical protein
MNVVTAALIMIESGDTEGYALLLSAIEKAQAALRGPQPEHDQNTRT